MEGQLTAYKVYTEVSDAIVFVTSTSTKGDATELKDGLSIRSDGNEKHPSDLLSAALCVKGI